tara:strand:+ start:1053 stop:1223 length:171 start_codon:yes stop_codon:yes gene_type:complete
MVRGSSAGAMLNIKHNKAEKIKIRLNIDTKDIHEKLEERYGKESRTMEKSVRQARG